MGAVLDCVFRQERHSEADKIKSMGHSYYFPEHKYFHTAKYAHYIEVGWNIHIETNASHLLKLPVSVAANKCKFTLM